MHILYSQANRKKSNQIRKHQMSGRQKPQPEGSMLIVCLLTIKPGMPTGPVAPISPCEKQRADTERYWHNICSEDAGESRGLGWGVGGGEASVP